jgi:riboflavin synthase
MFTGIIQGKGTVSSVQKKPNLLHFSLSLPEEFSKNLKPGASISINGVCLTVTSTSFTSSSEHPASSTPLVSFDVIDESLQKTTLGNLAENDEVNVERSAKLGDEIGGHLVSGHVHSTAKVVDLFQKENIWNITVEPPAELMKYIFEKGFIALDGASLTVVEVTPATFTVSLIPETLERTTFKEKKIGDLLNIEVDQQTRTIVETLERLQA